MVKEAPVSSEGNRATVARELLLLRLNDEVIGMVEKDARERG